MRSSQHNKPRRQLRCSATAKAALSCAGFSLDQRLPRVAARRPPAPRTMLDELLVRCETFHGLPPERLRSLAAHCAELPVPAGRLVFAHGEEADAVYLVVDGTITVFRDKVGKPMQLLARVGAGELLGEMCLFDETTRSASARAASECRLLRIARAPLLDLLRLEPALACASRTRRRAGAVSTRPPRSSSASRRRCASACARRCGCGSPTAASCRVELANLSVGGLSIADAPASWVPGRTVALRAAGGPRDAAGRRPRRLAQRRRRRHRLRRPRPRGTSA